MARRRALSSQDNAGLRPYIQILGRGGGSPNTPTTAIITHATGAVTLAPGETALVDTTTGSIATLTLGGGSTGSLYTVSDYGMRDNINNITVSPGTGALEDPNSPGVYQVAGTSCVFTTPGMTATWMYDGIGNYKLLLGSGT